VDIVAYSLFLPSSLFGVFREESHAELFATIAKSRSLAIRESLRIQRTFRQSESILRGKTRKTQTD
jgi:hypothetical protein